MIFINYNQKHNMLVHTATRLKFIQEANLKASDFDFARYLSVALGVTLGELVEIPVKTWFILEGLLLFFWRCELAFVPNARIVLWILTGYCTAAAAYLVHAKVKLILHQYTAPLIREHHSDAFHATTSQAELEQQKLEEPSSFIKVSTADPKLVKKKKSLVKKNNILQRFFFKNDQQNNAEAARLIHTNSSDEELGKHIHHYHDLFWYGHHFHAHFTFDVIRLISLLTSIYSAIFVLVYFDDLVWYKFDPSDYSPEAKSWRARGQRPGGIFIFLLAIIPPGIVVHKLKSILEDFTVCANISEFKNRRYIEQVLRRQKTVAAFECLKVVQCFRDPQMLEAVLAIQIDHDEQKIPESKRSSSPTEFLINLTGRSTTSPTTQKAYLTTSRRGTSIRALEKIKDEDAAAYIENQKTHWHRIFDLFDDDKEGSIDRQEMQNLLTNFKCDEEHINRIISVLDIDNDGTITFDEFFSFANKLETYLEEHADPEKLTAEMFDIIDSDASGTITVHEMHRVVAEMLGQDLSVEDVFNVIQDLDEDGNGELDIEEFTILLHRFRIYE
mmetsp:Transcript_16773/g.25211  ORF Transcript_16773/g.25211 Transcript_16773/m.25211 type:complete len:557 (+) Transcript_16773:53-1723(+)